MLPIPGKAAHLLDHVFFGPLRFMEQRLQLEKEGGAGGGGGGGEMRRERERERFCERCVREREDGF